MSGSISGASAPAHTAPSTDTSKQQAALNKLLQAYTRQLNSGQTPDQLSSLAKQITDAAKAIGQNVTLPKPSAPSRAAQAAPAPSNASTLNVKA